MDVSVYQQNTHIHSAVFVRTLSAIGMHSALCRKHVECWNVHVHFIAQDIDSTIAEKSGSARAVQHVQTMMTGVGAPLITQATCRAFCPVEEPAPYRLALPLRVL